MTVPIGVGRVSDTLMPFREPAGVIADPLIVVQLIYIFMFEIPVCRVMAKGVSRDGNTSGGIPACPHIRPGEPGGEPNTT